MSEKITVFDIEVLNQDPASLCAIGIVEIQNQEVISTYYALVKPKNLSFDSYRYKIHQIRPQSLYKEKTFVEVWKDIHHYFENYLCPVQMFWHILFIQIFKNIILKIYLK